MSAYLQKMDRKSTPDFTVTNFLFQWWLQYWCLTVIEAKANIKTRQHGPVDPSCIERHATKHRRAASGLCAKKPEGSNKAGYHQTYPKCTNARVNFPQRALPHSSTFNVSGCEQTNPKHQHLNIKVSISHCQRISLPKYQVPPSDFAQ